MIIFKDIITGDEVMSDSFEPQPHPENPCLLTVDCAMIEIGAVNVDTGANASAEEADEALEDGAVKVNNVVNSFSYQTTTFDSKGYKVYIKGYVKAVMKKMQELKDEGKVTDEQIAEFKGGAAGALKIINKGVDAGDYEFFTGESMDPDGMIILLNYREDGVTPYVTLWKHGLSEMKV